MTPLPRKGGQRNGRRRVARTGAEEKAQKASKVVMKRDTFDSTMNTAAFYFLPLGDGLPDA
jgi:hypothetical protein